MIPITPLEGLTVLLDVDLIEAIEPSSQPVIILTNGRRLVVSDAPDSLLERIRRARASRLAAADPFERKGSAVVEMRATGSDS